MDEKLNRRNAARLLSWQNFGEHITFYLPGMFRLNGHTGRYPAISISGNNCALQCDHCRGKILSDMIPAVDPLQLVAACRELSDKGQVGVLISGGCDPDGTIPWDAFLPALEKIKVTTDLFISVHCGLVDPDTARRLKSSGVDQALIDVIGDDRTFQNVYHLPSGVQRIQAAMEALAMAAIPIVPHIVCGIDHGRIRGEYRAVEMVAGFDVAQLVVVALMPIPGTPMAHPVPTVAEDIADVIAEARLKMPATPISLGCARKRGSGRLEELAIDAGVNRLALPSEEALERARAHNLTISFQPTCCSVTKEFYTESWL